MIAYIDSSVLMRHLLGQPNALPELSRVVRPVASKLLKVEGLRTLDRLRVRGLLSETELMNASEELRESVEAVEWVEITDAVLDRVSGSFATALGTLDAIHLSSAVLWRELARTELHFLTHDEALGRAARTLGFAVLGCLER
jgi:predicted nucleic acid-binding protein